MAAASAAGLQNTTSTHSYLLYVVARFCTSLNKHYIQFFGFPLTLFNRYLPVVDKWIKRCTAKRPDKFIKQVDITFTSVIVTADSCFYTNELSHRIT